MRGKTVTSYQTNNYLAIYFKNIKFWMQDVNLVTVKCVSVELRSSVIIQLNRMHTNIRHTFK